MNETELKKIVLATIKHGAVGKLVKPPAFQAGDRGFESRPRYKNLVDKNP